MKMMVVIMTLIPCLMMDEYMCQTLTTMTTHSTRSMLSPTHHMSWTICTHLKRELTHAVGEEKTRIAEAIESAQSQLKA